MDQIYLYARGHETAEEPFNWALFGWLVGGAAALVGVVTALITADFRRRRRIAADEIRASKQRDPDLRLTEQQRTDYGKYRYSHCGDDAVNNPAVWLPLYLANPALYSGGSSGTGSADGSSLSRGGGFTGGRATGSY